MNNGELDRIISSKYTRTSSDSTTTDRASKQRGGEDVVYIVLSIIAILLLVGGMITVVIKGEFRPAVLVLLVVGLVLVFISEFYKGYKSTRNPKVTLKRMFFYLLQVLIVGLLVQASRYVLHL